MNFDPQQQWKSGIYRHRGGARIAPMLTAKQIFSLDCAGTVESKGEMGNGPETGRAAAKKLKRETERKHRRRPGSLKVEGITPLKPWGGVKQAELMFKGQFEHHTRM